MFFFFFRDELWSWYIHTNIASPLATPYILQNPTYVKQPTSHPNLDPVPTYTRRNFTCIVTITPAVGLVFHPPLNYLKFGSISPYSIDLKYSMSGSVRGTNDKMKNPRTDGGLQVTAVESVLHDVVLLLCPVV